MTLATRRATGLPTWPLALIAGGPKAGKGWASAEASGSDLLAGTFWVSVGERNPDEYGAIDGADFDIVLHDGSFNSILQQLGEIAALPDDAPTLLVVDSGTKAWELLSAEAQEYANARARARNRGNDPTLSVDITPDVWAWAKGRWDVFMQAIRAHNGPAIITARMDALQGRDAQPGGQRPEWIKGEKALPYDVDLIVEMPSRGEAYLTGVRSVLREFTGREALGGEFRIDTLWRELGLADLEISPRSYIERVVETRAA